MSSNATEKYIRVYFPEEWFTEYFQDYFDIKLKFERLLGGYENVRYIYYDYNILDVTFCDCDPAEILKEVEGKLQNDFRLGNLWDFVEVKELFPVHFSIKPEPLCEEEILQNNPAFYEEFADALKKADGVSFVVCKEKAFHVTVEEKEITAFLKRVEQFMFARCKSDDPYHLLNILVKERRAEKLVQEYIEAYNIRSIDELFAELEQRLGQEKEGKIDMQKQEKHTINSNREGFDYPVKYSPEMEAYIKELRHVTKTLKEINCLDQFFSTSLLLSMDDGWGYSAFLRYIGDEMRLYFGERELAVQVEEREVSTEHGVDSWENEPENMKRIAENMVKSGRMAILAYDLRPWMNELFSPELLNHLRRVGQYAQNVLCVFRLPYMEKKALERIVNSLEDVLSLRTVQIPPIAVENMVIYLKNKLSEEHFAIKEDTDALLEKWIIQERAEGNFYGYKTLNKMAGELIYYKALHRENKEVFTFISRADVEAMLKSSTGEKDPYQELDELIGISDVKTRVKEVIAQIKFQRLLEEQGKPVDKPSIHMMFTGNPGTGKTTVARIIGKILKQEGILSKGHFLEKQGNDFVTRYVGHASQKTKQICKEAHGSILFIDEAYGMSVFSAKGNASEESLPILIAEMENHRDDMCVIMAGYTEEMMEFMKLNSGLESRIPYIIEFPNYTKDELMQIFFHMLDGKFDYEEELKETAINFIQNIPDEVYENKTFSNGRFIRNLYEKLWGKAAYRISLSGEKDLLLKKEDMEKVIEEFNWSEITDKKGLSRIGF